MKYPSLCLALLFCLSAFLGTAQVYPLADIDFTVNGKTYRNSLAGGLNSPQFSAVDLNNDQILDLYVFDRIGNVSLTFINGGTPNETDYDFNNNYALNFPKLTDWVLLRDFNFDGAMDIFSYSDANGIDGVVVYQGFFENNELHFERFNFYDNANNLIYFPLPSSGIKTNLYVSTEDYPAVDDIDSDGDLDIITFGNGGGYIFWFRNTSVENGFGTDSLHFVIEDQCLGNAYESGQTACLDLSLDADSCATGNPFDGGALERHAGSTVLLFDEDNDGDKEIILGDVNGQGILRATNGGDGSSPWWTAQDCEYPSYDESAYVVTFPAAFHIDVDNDDKRDLLVSPNRGALAEDINCVHFYKNENTEELPVFNKTSENLFVDEMLDMGTGARPAFADFNADGLIDLLIGNETYHVIGGSRDPRLFLYLNIGTSSNPAFELIDDDYLSLSAYTLNFSLTPSLGDIDNDGDDDLVVGEEDGQLFFFENTAGAGNAIEFGLVQFPWMDIDAKQRSTPQIIDLDRDGLMDLVIGNRNGILNFYKNIGSTGNPMFNPDETESPNITFLGQVDTRLTTPGTVGYASPFFVDFEGDYVLFTGSNTNQIIRYDDIDGNLNGAFTLVDSVVGKVNVGFYSHPAFVDLTGSGTLEMAVGNRRGGIGIYHTNLLSDGTESGNIEPGDELDITVKPNPASDRIIFDVFGAGDQQILLTCYDNLGRVLIEKTGLGVRQIMDVSRMTAGVYYCKVISGKLSKVVKFVVR